MSYCRNPSIATQRHSVSGTLYQQGMGKVSCSMLANEEDPLEAIMCLHLKPLSKTQVY
jgi:hypothetical protein